MVILSSSWARLAKVGAQTGLSRVGHALALAGMAVVRNPLDSRCARCSKISANSAQFILNTNNEIARGLDRCQGCREIARSLGRAPSTVANEVAARRYVTAPRALRGEGAPADAELAAACPRLGAWPRCCNGCPRRRGYGCPGRPQVFYDARMAQREADAVLSGSRRARTARRRRPRR